MNGVNLFWFFTRMDKRRIKEQIITELEEGVLNN